MMTDEGSDEVLISSESTTEQVFVSTARGEARQLLGQVVVDPLSYRRSTTGIVRQWFDELKQRASQIVTTPMPAPHPPLSPGYSADISDDEYFLVAPPTRPPDFAGEASTIHDPNLEMSVMADIQDAPFSDLIWENRLMELETNLEACEIEYERKIQTLERNLQSESLAKMQAKVKYEQRIQDLEDHINRLEKENKNLREEQTKQEKKQFDSTVATTKTHVPDHVVEVTKLQSDQIARYSRQLLLKDGFGVHGQCKLLSSKVIVVGAGGIGSTALFYLAAMGIGHITVIDFDVVEVSNLHRQIIHHERNVKMNKAISACKAMKELNPSVSCTAVQEKLTFDNALKYIAGHDCVVDATDNSTARYLINDACVLANKPLVSGSAIGTEGQLTVYNHDNGPCYRCMYPTPNKAEACKSCSDNGVLGPVPGLIGVMESVEVIKILTGVGTAMNTRMLLYDSLSCRFMNIAKPPKASSCIVCSEAASIKTMKDSYNAHTANDVCIRPPAALHLENEISCLDYAAVRSTKEPHVLLDVRAKQQFDMCSLEGAISIPLQDLKSQLDRLEELSGGTQQVYCICRRGVFSVEATKMILDARREGILSVKNIKGGLEAWRDQVDSAFPKY